jgi:vesicle-associated membrane protein-associated protein A
VKTTQPRRYLVRPNQGIVAPGSTETVSILLVDKERSVLWSTYDRLGQSALDHSKDKFLVQSCAVSDEFSSQFRNEPRGEAGQYKPELIEALTAMWNSATSGSIAVPMFNKKLHVRHVAAPMAGGASSAAGGGAMASSSASMAGTTSAASGSASAAQQRSLPSAFQRNNTDQMNSDQLHEEVASLRRKYDELVAFSVNLTAERDILNNTLEQTKRDLNREMATRSALEKQGLKVSSRSQDMKSKQSRGGGGGVVSIKALVIAMVISFLFAVKATNNGSVGVLKKVPVLRGMLGFECCSKHKKKDDVVVTVETTSEL